MSVLNAWEKNQTGESSVSYAAAQGRVAIIDKVVARDCSIGRRPQVAPLTRRGVVGFLRQRGYIAGVAIDDGIRGPWYRASSARS